MIPPNWVGNRFSCLCACFGCRNWQCADAREKYRMVQTSLLCQQRLSVAEKNYSVKERECLGMIYSVKIFWHYLLGQIFFFHVDHSALLYLVR